MKSKCNSNLWRGLALSAVVLSLANSSGSAQFSPAPVKSPASVTNSIVPATRMASPSVGKAVPATPSTDIAEDILDIRGPRHIPSTWLWSLWLAGGVALAALLYAAWRWNRRRTLVATLLPYEIALARLEEARGLMQPENAREFSIAVSEIVRHYIEERFQVLAERRTTEEFLHDLLEPSDALLTSHRELLADFLNHCDLAKFARWILSLEEMETMLASANTFVLQTGRASAAEGGAVTMQAVTEPIPTATQPAHANL